MPKKTVSDAYRGKSKAARKGTARSTRLGRALTSGMKRVLAHVRGEIELDNYYLPGPVDVKAIRKKTGLSQIAFARRFALSPRTVQEWEQGKSAPETAARAYLTVIDRNPRAVTNALSQG